LARKEWRLSASASDGRQGQGLLAAFTEVSGFDQLVAAQLKTRLDLVRTQSHDIAKKRENTPHGHRDYLSLIDNDGLYDLTFLGPFVFRSEQLV